jgi:predicted TIM-barrel fold metal-dependent hydrolase
MIGGRRYFSDAALAEWADNFALGHETPDSAREVVHADAQMLVEALDTAEAALGEEYRICVFAIDLRPRFEMEVGPADLNDWVLEQAAVDPRGRILPFACVTPTMPDAAAEVRRAGARGARGYKVYPPTGFSCDDPAADPFWEAVVETQQRVGRPLPVLAHTGFSYSGSSWARPVQLQDVAVRYGPELTVIAAHVGIPWVDEALFLAGIHENFYVDIAAFGDVAGWWPELHGEAIAKGKRLGAVSRILYGTDWPLSAFWLPPDDGPAWRNLHEVAAAVRAIRTPESLTPLGYPELTEDDLTGILGGNAERMLQL